MKTLAIGMRSDDILFGCGGTLMRLDEAGHQIFLLTGEKSTDADEHPLTMLSFTMRNFIVPLCEDTFFVERELVQSMKTIIAEINPTLVFVPYPEDLIPELKCFAQCAIS